MIRKRKPPRLNSREPEGDKDLARSAPALYCSPELGRGGLCFFLALSFCGCGHPVQETAAHKIADRLPSVLGPAAHYDVQVDGDPFALARGRARAVHVQGVGVQISPTLTLDTLNADVRDVSFDTKTRRLSHLGETTFTASLGQDNLSRYLAQFKPRLPGLIVTLLPDSVEAQIPVSALGLHTTAALSGSFRPDSADPSRLDFAADGAQIGPVPLPASLVNLALDSVNPLVDLSDLRVPLTVTDAKVQNRRLVLSGTADLSGLVPP